MEVEKRVPVKLANLEQIQEKNPHFVFTVRGTNGDVLAQMSKVVLDAEGQRPQFAVLYLFENVTQDRTFVAVPWETLTINTDTGDLFTSASLEKLRQAQAVRVEDVPDRAPANWGTQYYGFYGIQPRQSEPEPNAVGVAGQISGEIKGSGSSRNGGAAAVDAHRGNTVYIGLALVLVIFGVTMFSRRRPRASRKRATSGGEPLSDPMATVSSVNVRSAPTAAIEVPRVSEMAGTIAGRLQAALSAITTPAV